MSFSFKILDIFLEYSFGWIPSLLSFSPIFSAVKPVFASSRTFFSNSACVIFFWVGFFPSFSVFTVFFIWF